MMNNGFDLPDEYREKLTSIVEVQTTNFSELVKVAGLSKAHDFRDTNLSQVDFTDSDLRGFDFTNADLSGTYGRNFRIDETTILTGAIVRSSVLAFEKERREYFSQNHEHYALYQRLKKEYWSHGAVWIGENLRRTSKHFHASAKIAKYLYSSVKDQTYKNQILYGIKNTFESGEEYKHFLLDQLRDGDLPHRSLRSVIDILTRLFINDPLVKHIILSYLGHENAEVRKLCVPPVSTRKFFETNIDVIVDHMRDEKDVVIRRLYTQAICYNSPLIDRELLYNEASRCYHDYFEPVDETSFRVFVRGYARRMKIATASSSFIEKNPQFGIDISFREMGEVFVEVHEQISRIAKIGLPITINYKLDAVERLWFGSKFGTERERLA